MSSFYNNEGTSKNKVPFIVVGVCLVVIAVIIALLCIFGVKPSKEQQRAENTQPVETYNNVEVAKDDSYIVIDGVTCPALNLKYSKDDGVMPFEDLVKLYINDIGVQMEIVNGEDDFRDLQITLTGIDEETLDFIDGFNLQRDGADIPYDKTDTGIIVRNVYNGEYILTYGNTEYGYMKEQKISVG